MKNKYRYRRVRARVLRNGNGRLRSLLVALGLALLAFTQINMRSASSKTTDRARPTSTRNVAGQKQERALKAASQALSSSEVAAILKNGVAKRP